MASQVSFQNSLVYSLLDSGALEFKPTTLKSGRLSPYFCNSGQCYDGKTMSKVADAFAQIIHDRLFMDIKNYVLVGPPYKGISLATATATALFKNHNMNIPFATYRKEEKDHGEGGIWIGPSLNGKKVIVVDDVITSGKALLETKAKVDEAGGEVFAEVVLLDRQEYRTNPKISAIQEIEKDTGINILSALKCIDVFRYLEGQPHREAALAQLRSYALAYGSPELQMNVRS